MYPANFDYQRPASVDEAIALLAKHGDDAKVLAGGHSLIPAMKLRLARPAVIVDIGRIANLSYIREAGGAIAIGAMTTHQEIERSTLLRGKSPLLAETAAHIGDSRCATKERSAAAWRTPTRQPIIRRRFWRSMRRSIWSGPRGTRTLKGGPFFVDLLQTAIGRRRDPHRRSACR